MTGALAKRGSFTGFFFSGGRARAAAFPILGSSEAGLGDVALSLRETGEGFGSDARLWPLTIEQHTQNRMQLKNADLIKTFVRDAVGKVNFCLFRKTGGKIPVTAR